MKIEKIFIFTFLILIYVIPVAVWGGKIGVGVAPGKIMIEEELKPGGTYYLSSMSVINTGEIGSYYAINLGSQAGQEQLRPEKEWLVFSPDKFYLDTNKSQLVRITLNLPLKTQPGEYLVFLQASPVKENQSGASVGIAAATKLYFTVLPGNIFQAIYYKYYIPYHPWNTIVIGIIILAIIFTFLGRKFKIQVTKK